MGFLDKENDVLTALYNIKLLLNGTISEGSSIEDLRILLDQINTNVASNSDWEAAYVKDEGNGNKIVWAVRIYDESAGTFSSVSYYEADGTPYTITGPISFVDNRALLVSILAEFSGNETNGADDISNNASFTLSGNVTSYTLIVNEGTVEHLGIDWEEGSYTWSTSLNKTFNGSLDFDATNSSNAKLIWTKQ